MDQDVQAAPGLVDALEDPVEVGVAGDVGRHNQRTVNRRREIAYAVLDALALERERQFRALARQGLSNGPGNAAAVRNAKN